VASPVRSPTDKRGYLSTLTIKQLAERERRGKGKKRQWGEVLGGPNMPSHAQALCI